MRIQNRFDNLFVYGDEDRIHHLSSTRRQNNVQPQQHRPDILPHDDVDLIDRRLLLDLAEMEDTIDRDPYAYTREERCCLSCVEN
jgi:hypothetical protein